MPQLLYCQTHPKEPIIRASLNPDDKQLLFCYKCLENDKLSKLTEFGDLVSILRSRYANLHPYIAHQELLIRVSNSYSNEKIVKQKFVDQINGHKIKADIEIKALEKQARQLLRSVRIKTHEALEEYGVQLTESVDAYCSEINRSKVLIPSWAILDWTHPEKNHPGKFKAGDRLDENHPSVILS